MAKGGPSRFQTQPVKSDTESDYTSSSEDVSEDEFGEELTPALDAAILQTLGKIKRKEGVYGSENVLQEALKEAERRAGSLGVQSLKRVVADKPYLLADHHRAALLGDGMEVEDDSVPLTNVQEQRKLRQGAISAFQALAGEEDSEADDEAEEDAGFVLKQRKRDEGELEQEDEEYRRFLLDMGGGEEEVRKILGIGDAPAWRAEEIIEETSVVPEKKKKKRDSVLNKAEKEEIKREHQEKKEKADDDFLMNYILNRGWIDRSDKHVPTYDEVVADVKEDVEDEGVDQKPGQSSSHPWGVLEEDDFDEKAEEFENAYNFRYEEPGSSNILTHPREIPSLVRRTDDARKLKRQAREERKAAEKAAAEEETRRLKGAKRREMEAHIEALKAELGDGLDYSILEEIMEGDFEEEEWDRVVGQLMDQAAEQEDDKPAWDDLGDAEYDEQEGEGADYDSYAYNMDIFGGEAAEEDDGPINMDADFADEQPKKKSKKDKKSKKGKEREIEVEEDLSVEARTEKVKKTLGEYKALDHEDMIGDLPTRFKYTQSAPVDFGLSPVEILLATDAELNALAAMKHLAPYKRGTGMGRASQGLNKRIRDLKRTLQARRWGEEAGSEEPEPKEKGSGSNAGPTSGVKRKWGGDGNGQNGQKGDAHAEDKGPEKKTATSSHGGPQKRLGKKQRLRAKLAAGAAAGGDAAPEPLKSASDHGLESKSREEDGEGGGVGGEGKKKRRKKKKSGVANGNGGLE